MSLKDTILQDDNTSESPRTFSWPTPETVYFTLDLECDFGTALPRNTYEAVEHIETLATLLETTDTPLTCFLQTEVLTERPEAVERLRSSDVPVEFYPHSHTHSKRDQTSVRQEIQASTESYTEFFDHQPEGYRFPNGNIREIDYRHLESYGYQFDASIFPTWRPGHFENTDAPAVPTYMDEFDLFELPFTILSSLAPIPTGLSYCRLLGRPFTYSLTNFAPSVIVFNFHVHDLVTPATVTELPPLYRFVYSRNNHGFSLLRELLEAFDKAGYTFDTLGTAHEQLRAFL